MMRPLASSRLAFGGLVACAFACAPACTTGDAANPQNATGGVRPREGLVTFHKDIAPILERSCRRCHVRGGIAPFALTTVQEAQNFGKAMATETTARRMPPWGAETTSECTPPHPWKGDPGLSEQEIAKFVAWHADGDLEGAPAEQTVISSTTNPTVPTQLLVGASSLAPAVGYKIAKFGDSMQCFLLDPKIETTKYLNGTVFVPQNITAVHHARAFAIPKDAMVGGRTPADPAISIDAIGSPYECFGGPRIDGARLLAAWAPGDVPAEYPPDTGVPLEPGTRFVMQVHYHPHHGTFDPDATTFHYRLTDTKPTYVALPQLIGDIGKPRTGDLPARLMPSEDDPPHGPELLIPIGKKRHIETMTFTIPTGYPELRVASVGGHMHLAAKEQKVTSTNGKDGTSTCLIHQPRWSFDWQRSYSYAAPVEQLPILNPGDSVDIQCIYDNSATNYRLLGGFYAAGYTQNKEVRYGESPTDEMCQASFVFLSKAN